MRFPDSDVARHQSLVNVNFMQIGVRGNIDEVHMYVQVQRNREGKCIWEGLELLSSARLTGGFAEFTAVN